MQQEPVVRLEGVTKKVSSKTLVEDVTLDIPPGQVFGFLGPNGAGKTTTIRMMVGLTKITKGDIKICGYSIKDHFEQAIVHVGAIVENPEMYKFLTGYENLRHFARMMSGITEERIQEVVQLVGLSNRIQDPGIRELRDYLRRLCREEGTTVFVSSHLLSEMELMCDAVAIIQNGRLIDVRTLAGVEGAQETTVETAFALDRPEQAQELLGGGTIRDGLLIVRLDRNGIADTNARLVQSGFKVYGIQKITRSLEDQFLEMTGSDQIG
ncbi:hypothetical protein BGX30_003911 [Mortierella sp. GBA39]|nr:hypothetical protein BGX30_003911 [Mortierella sp. GBA39]